MTIRTTDSVFLGVVVQPKTKQPVYVVREPGTTKNVQIWAHRAAGGSVVDAGYFPLGRGYLEDDSGGEYAHACQVTGLPRAHTPSGVSVKGGGFGTCLYTGLVLLAVAAHDRKLYVSSLCGDGYGICSDSETRSDQADAWWEAMAERGLVEEQKGETSEKEEEEGADVERYVSRRGWRNILEAIGEAISDTEWSLQRVRTVEADLERGTDGEEIAADIYTMDSAESANLVAVVDVAQGDFMAWAKARPTPGGRRYKDVLLALNVADEDAALVGKIALVAREAGASEREVTALLMRNRFGRDIYVGQAAPPMFPLLRDIDRELIASGKTLPPPSEHGAAIPNPQPIRTPRRNPVTPTPAERREIDRDLAELERRRADLGWDKLEDLP